MSKKGEFRNKNLTLSMVLLTVKSPPKDWRFEQNSQTLASALWEGTFKIFGAPPWVRPFGRLTRPLRRSLGGLETKSQKYTAQFSRSLPFFPPWTKRILCTHTFFFFQSMPFTYAQIFFFFFSLSFFLLQ